MENIAKLQEAIEGVKLTPAQKLIVAELLKGRTIIFVNQHRKASELMWIENDDVNTISYAGAIYKAFWGVQYSIKKAKGIDFPIGELFISKLNDVRY